MNYLERERKNSKIDSEKLAEWLYNSKQNLIKWKAMQKIVNNDPELKFKFESLSFSRPVLFLDILRRSVRYHELIGFNDPSNQIIIDNPLVGFLHRLMVVPALQLLADDEQLKIWQPSFLNYQFIGAYAQTEMGHGSDVQGLQTTATYDKQNEQFIINSPNVSSIKYWQGELGVSANHAIVQAQLILNGKRYGIHHFMVRIRDQQTHKPMPGIQVGDIGPKIGWMSQDNGYLQMNNIRIPRRNMLMRYSVVTKEGDYKQIGHQKMSYAAMVYSRKQIIKNSPHLLGQASVIGLRYSAFRTQFPDENGKQRILLDFNAHIDQLVPILAMSFLQMKGADFLSEIFDQTIEMGSQFNDFSMLPDLHGISSGLKALYTWNAHFGIDIIRMSCGGHGYSDFSGLSSIWRHNTSCVTGEGQNTMIMLQCARYVLNSFTLAMQDPKNKRISPYLDFFRNSKNILSSQYLKEDPQKQLKSITVIEDLLIYRVVFLSSSISNLFIQYLNGEDGLKKLSYKEVWDIHAGASLVELGIIFSQYITYKSFSKSILEISHEENQIAMQKLLKIYGLHSILEQPLSLLEGGCIVGSEIQFIREENDYLIQDIRKDVISISDGFMFDDDTLKSALARSDGKIYQKMLELANLENPLNETQFKIKAFEHIKQLREVKPKL